MANRIRNVLFLCTGNSARSVLAEATLNELGQGRFRAFSAGSQPAGQVNPFTLDLLQRKGFDVSGYRSKSWDEFAQPGAPRMDFIFTVCGNAAGETCPVWPGHPASAHWGFEDPAAFRGPDEEKREVFDRIHRQIEARIRKFLALPVDTLDRAALLRELQAIGRNPP